MQKEIMSVTDEIKAQIDIIDLISESVKLRHTGKNYTGFCPFHSNTKTPAFVVFPETQTWRCFGQCNEGGDIFGFVMKKEGWDFTETLHYLAGKAGITLTSTSQDMKLNKDALEELHQVLESAASFFRQQMFETDSGRKTYDYLKIRGLSDETIKIFSLGYAPESWDNLISHLKTKGYNEELMFRAGLITERESGGFYDRFRNRLTIPIRSTYGKMIGFGARICNPEDLPKYLNSPRTETFDKGRVVYGLDLARQSIRTKDQAVIVEGYFDVIGLHQAGFTNVVSPMGTALTEDQFRLVKKFTRNIILALDPDAAGEKATLRGLETARQTMDQSTEMIFDARGLLHFEARLNADIRVTTLPDGLDPDEIVLKDPQLWQTIVESAKPVVEHVMDMLVNSKNIDDAKVKSQVAAQVLPLIEDIPDQVEREAYRQKLARLIKVDERALISSFQSSTRIQKKQAVQIDKKDTSSKILNKQNSRRLLEKFCLQFLFRDPERIYYINGQLSALGFLPLTQDDFNEQDHIELFNLLQNSLSQDEISPKEFVDLKCPKTFIEDLQVQTDQKRIFDIPPEKELSDLIRTLLRLRKNNIETEIEELIFLQSLSPDHDDEELVVSYQVSFQEKIKLKKRLDDVLNNPISVKNLTFLLK